MKALIVVHIPTWFTELSQLGSAMHRVDGNEAVFYVADFGEPAMMQDIAASARSRGVPCFLETERHAPTLPQRAGRLAARIVRRTIGRDGESELAELLEARRLLKTAMAHAHEIARAERPDVAVLGGDMPGYTTSAFIRGFHQLGIPSAIVASTMSNGIEQAEIYSGEPGRHVDRRWQGRWIAKRHPRWVRTHQGLRLLPVRPGRVLALESLGLAPRQPWVFNSGFADAIAMESEAMTDYYVEAGLPRGNMVLTGSPSDDAMAKALADAPRLREALYAELGLPAGRPMLLLGLVSDFLYVKGGRPQCDFREYDDLARFIVGTVTDQPGFNVVIAVHPSVRPETMRHLEGPNVRIAARRTAELVPLCDVYSASTSSTIRWAIQCGKPVVNYDVYRFRYTDFVGVPGVIETEEKEEYRSQIRMLCTDAGYLSEMRRRQEGVAARWGRLDGGSTARIVALLGRLAATRGVAIAGTESGAP